MLNLMLKVFATLEQSSAVCSPSNKQMFCEGLLLSMQSWALRIPIHVLSCQFSSAVRVRLVLVLH